ncbi:MAG: hypothetical protein HY360_12795 [Verrucomicrobia bacterium]|nr:hypothetical protein [Verrucomicrobiota bacterium]
MKVKGSGIATLKLEDRLIRNPIHKVLSTLYSNQTTSLLMGGQACIFYGGAEFSRDIDLLVPATTDNLKRLETALADLQAECIALPPFEQDFLERGHAVHFRCHHPEAERIRVDVMAQLRDMDGFSALWERRTPVQESDGTVYHLLALPDLIHAKKTQRDKDWLMIRRLVEAHFRAKRDAPETADVQFWLREMRTPEILIQVARDFCADAVTVAAKRPLLVHARAGDETALAAALRQEQERYQEEDRRYWKPRLAEIETLRRQRLRARIGC